LKLLQEGKIEEFNKARQLDQHLVPNLSKVSLRNAYLEEADLEGANLREANVSGAYLREANLHRADLSWMTSLARADIFKADLSDAQHLPISKEEAKSKRANV
jgi:uncharacterized protein YjbI with pentapeptide repeats